MAAGEAFVNMHIPIAAASSVDVQPAAGVQVCITFIGCGFSGTAWNCHWYGKNAVGSHQFGLSSGNDNNSGEMRRQLAGNNMKLFINNSQYFSFSNAGAVPEYFAYTGIEL